MNEVDLEMIEKTGKSLKLQSRKVVDRMIEMMRLASKGNGSLDWTDFRQMITKLVPLNLEDQITLFLRAYVPKNLMGD